MANFNVTSGNAFRFSISAECVNDNLRVRINNESFIGDLYSINNSFNLFFSILAHLIKYIALLL